MKPTIGRTVIYKLSAENVQQIDVQRARSGAYAIFVSEGQEFPLVIVRVWPYEFGDQPGVNGQVILDGPDTLWVTSVGEGTEPGQWHWPERV